MSIALCVVLLTPAIVLLVLILVVAIRPATSTALAEVLHASAEPLKAIAPWRRRDPKPTRDGAGDSPTGNL